jgi:hypothetical protein
MSETPKRRNRNIDVDSAMNEILDTLDTIKSRLPNGELAAIQERMESIENAQDGMKDDLRTIRKQLLDPEDGIVVRVNKNTDFRRRKESEEKDFTKIIDEHKELMSWKQTVTKILWTIFTVLAGLVISAVFKLQN